MSAAQQEEVPIEKTMYDKVETPKPHAELSSHLFSNISEPTPAPIKIDMSFP